MADLDNIPGSILIRRWCDPCSRPVWRWFHRHHVDHDWISGG